MKKFARWVFVGLIVVSLNSCIFPGYKLKPGDKIGEMEFINEYSSCVAPNFNEICSWDALRKGTCKIPASQTKFWISTGMTWETQEELEQNWLGSEWKMTFDGQPVDLYVFGTFDFDLAGKKARGWNVCISNPVPGTHTVRYDFYKPNGVERGNFQDEFVFTVLAPNQAGDSSSTTTNLTQIAPENAVMIQPGDVIRDFLITTGAGDEITYLWELDSRCVQGRDPNIDSCEISFNTKMNVSWGVYDDTSSGLLDENWADHTYEMYIDGRPVNLQAFGSIDVIHPQVGPMRHWNVVIIPKRPGEITVYSKGVVGGEPFEGSTTYTFSAP